MNPTHFDAPVVDENTVHFLVSFLRGAAVFELNKGVIERVAREEVSDDLALHHGSETAGREGGRGGGEERSEAQKTRDLGCQ
jgi:hypothetical protein